MNNYFDGHIHTTRGPASQELFLEGIAAAGISGGAVISASPSCFQAGMVQKEDSRERLDALFARTEGCSYLFPLFWIDPLEENALEQVDIACEYGVLGFKAICDRYYPFDSRPMEVIKAIARKGKPVLFHSGILWDGKFSSQYNRPAGFEAFLCVENLRFSLAHASWPWVDECIALYGKVLNAKSIGQGSSAEMFIDITPGTPEIYRRELLTKLYTVGYDVENNIIFGSDCVYENYNSQWTRHWIDMDTEIYSGLNLGEEVVNKVFNKNLLRFLGLLEENISYRPLTSADS